MLALGAARIRERQLGVEYSQPSAGTNVLDPQAATAGLAELAAALNWMLQAATFAEPGRSSGGSVTFAGPWKP